MRPNKKGVKKKEKEDLNKEDNAPPPPPPTAQWKHGRGMKICINPGLVKTTGAIETI